MQPAWLEVRVDVPAAAEEAVANHLIELGSPGLVTEDRNGHVVITAYFTDSTCLDRVHRYVGHVSPGEPTSISSQWINSEDWAENWKQHFPPLTVGERFFIHAPWVADRVPDRLAIVIDPGMAFGTGHHATTCGCLQLIERYLPVDCRAALDVGTGSGILAIGLAKLGVAHIMAVDIDPDARAAAVANIACNGVAGAVVVAASLDLLDDRSFPLIVANIQRSTLLDLLPRLTMLAADDAVLIVSGLLRADLVSFLTAGEGTWALRERLDDGEWTSLALYRCS